VKLWEMDKLRDAFILQQWNYYQTCRLMNARELKNRRIGFWRNELEGETTNNLLFVFILFVFYSNTFKWISRVINDLHYWNWITLCKIDCRLRRKFCMGDRDVVKVLEFIVRMVWGGKQLWRLDVDCRFDCNFWTSWKCPTFSKEVILYVS
jgi:hypothetical protein